MKLLSNLFNHKIGSEAEAIIKKISKWEQEHFSNAGYTYDIKTGNRLTNSRYTTFKNDYGNTVDLSSISLMFTENPERKGIFNRLKNLTNPQPKPSLPALIAQYRSDVSKEIQTYRANVKKLDNLDGTLKRESMKGMKENALQCLHNGGTPGLGYDVDETQHIVINEEEAKIVAMIYSMYLSGYSCKVIAETLNEEGYITKAGNPFQTASVYTILINEKYTGVYIFNRAEAKGYDHKRNTHRSKPPEEIIRIEGGISAIISKEVWEAVQKKRMRKSGKLKTSEPMYLLSGKIFCGVCGSKMYGSIRYRCSAEPYYKYACHTKKAFCSNPKEIEKASLENYVVSLIQKHCGLDEAFFEMPHDAPPFRYKLQDYIHSVTVCPKTVTVKIYVDEEVRTFRHGRKTFKTPKQRCFK